jgi:hypothetical protein
MEICPLFQMSFGWCKRGHDNKISPHSITKYVIWASNWNFINTYSLNYRSSNKAICLYVSLAHSTCKGCVLSPEATDCVLCIFIPVIRCYWNKFYIYLLPQVGYLKKISISELNTVGIYNWDVKHNKTVIKFRFQWLLPVWIRLSVNILHCKLTVESAFGYGKVKLPLCLKN